MYHVAQLLTQIKNANMANKTEISVSFTNLKKGILEVLKANGYISDFKVYKEGDRKYININTDSSNSSFNDVKIISKPSKRVYASVQELKNNKSGVGIFILTTPKGVLSHTDAIKNKAGGELICKIW